MFLKILNLNTPQKMLPPIESILDKDVDSELDEQLRTLLSTCFLGKNNERFKTQRFFNEMPQYRWIMREPGRVIAHVAFHEKTIGTDGGEFPIGAVAEVATHPDFRGKGLIKLLLTEAHKSFSARSVPFAVLFGNTKVYSSSGYVPVTNPLRFFDPVQKEWIVRPHASVMVKTLSATPWPNGEIDLRGPTF